MMVLPYEDQATDNTAIRRLLEQALVSHVRGSMSLLPPPDTMGAAEEGIVRSMEACAISFKRRRLDDQVKGYLISQNGHRMIVVADDLLISERIALYVHMVGHVVLGHVPERELRVIFELRDPFAGEPDQVREHCAAEMWAMRLLTLSGFEPGVVHMSGPGEALEARGHHAFHLCALHGSGVPSSA